MAQRLRCWTVLAAACGLLLSSGATMGALSPPALALLDLSAAPHAGALHQAAAVAKAGTLLRARDAGIDVPLPAPVQASASPGAAAEALLAAHGVAATPEQSAAVRALDGAQEPARGALVRFLDAFRAFEAASLASLAGAAGADLDHGPVLAARAGLLDAVVGLHDALSGTPQAGLPGPVAVAPVLSLDFRAVDNAYASDFVLLFDAGGNDTYVNNGGGSGGIPAVDGGVVAAALVDLGGDDRYVGNRTGGINGGGHFGSGFLLDAAGDDLYLARDDGTNGGAFAGTGFLLDVSGDDDYLVTGWGANGGAYPGGFGFLLDHGGNDTYEGQYEGVNGGGFLGGVGFLYDAWGDDAYVAEFAGVNGGGFAGGRGLLVDGAGNDRYAALSGGVNGGGELGAGLLLDAGGFDVYEDWDGGSGEDVDVVPKGAGAQVDA